MSGKIVNISAGQSDLQEHVKEALQHASREIKHEVNSNVEKTAKKDIRCNASDWLRVNLTKEVFESMTEDERNIVLRVRRNNFMIKKGDKFIRQVGMYDGKQYVSKFLLDVMLIVDKYKLQIK